MITRQLGGAATAVNTASDKKAGTLTAKLAAPPVTYEEVFIRKFSKRIADFLVDFGTLFATILLLASTAKSGFFVLLRVGHWLRLAVVLVPWCLFILASIKAHCSRGWREVVVANMLVTVAVLYAFYSIFWFFRVYPLTSSSVRYTKAFGILPAGIFLWQTLRRVRTEKLAVLPLFKSQFDAIGTVRNGLIASFVRNSANIAASPWSGARWDGVMQYAAGCLIDVLLAVIVRSLALLQLYYLEDEQQHPFITENASVELETADAVKRAHFFDEMDSSSALVVPASRKICEAAVRQLKELSVDLEASRLYLDALEKCTLLYSIGLVLADAFQKQEFPLVALLRRIVLAVPQSRYFIDWYARIIRSLHYRSGILPSPPWLRVYQGTIRGITAFILASFDEDAPGQTQFSIAPVVDAMADCVIAINRLYESTVLPRASPSKDLIAQELLWALRSLLIESPFSRCIDQLGFSESTRSKLHSLDFLPQK